MQGKQKISSPIMMAEICAGTTLFASSRGRKLKNKGNNVQSF